MKLSDPAIPESNKELPRVSLLYIILLVSFSLGTSSVSFCSAQVLQLTARKFTTSMTLIGFIISLQALNQLWVTPYAAWKSDRIWTRIGRRKPLVLIMTPALAFTVALVPHCPTLWLLVMLVFVMQMAEDAELAVLMPAIGDSVPDRQRPLATALWQFMLAASAFVMGRFVMRLMDRAEHWPYTVAAVTVLVTGVIFLKVMRERYVPPRPHDRFRPFAYGKEIIQCREHVLIYIIYFFQPLFYLVSASFLATLAKVDLHMKPSEYGAALSYGAMTTLIISVPLGYLFNRWKKRRAVTIGACLMALAPVTFGYFFMHDARGVALFFVMREVMFIIYRMNFTPLVMEYTTPKNVATVMGFTTAVNGMVRFTMIPLAGLLVDMGILAPPGTLNFRLPLLGGYVGIAICVACLLMMRPPEKVREMREGEHQD